MTNEEMALAIQAGDDSIVLPLFTQNMGFIYQQAKKWEEAFQPHPEYDIEDLQQNAYFAVLEGAQRFDPNKGLYITVLAYTLKTAFSELCGVRTEAQRKDPMKSALRLEAPLPGGDKEGEAFGDTIADQRNGIEEVEEAMYSSYVSDTVHKAVNNLNDRQRNCIDLIYFHSKTASEIGKQLDISAQSVYAAKKDGIRNIRKGRYMPVLSEIYYGTRNYYRGNDLASFRNTGSSLPEMELLRKEQFDQQCQAAIKRISRERKLPCL